MRIKRIMMKIAAGLLLLTLSACGGGITTSEPTPAATLPPVATATATAAVPTGPCANPLFPVLQGATWTYMNSGGPTTFTYTDTITAVRADGFTLTSQFDLEPQDLTRTQEWSCTPEGLTALTFGGNSAAGLSTQNMTAQFTTSGVSGVTLPANITPGLAWTYGLNVEGTMNLPDGQAATATGTVTMNFQETGTESVTVPAGTFNATRIQATSTFSVTASFQGVDIPLEITGTSTLWYAPGVGLVKSTETSTVAGAPISTTTELQSYSIP